MMPPASRRCLVAEDAYGTERLSVVVEETDASAPSGAGGDVVRSKSRGIPTKKAGTETNNEKNVDCLPDMTGRVITVSAEETAKLTKDRKKKLRGAGGRGLRTDTAAGEGGIEGEFRQLVASLSSSKDGLEGGERAEEKEGAGDMGKAERAARAARRRSSYLSEYTNNDASDNPAARRQSSYLLSEYTPEDPEVEGECGESETDPATQRQSACLSEYTCDLTTNTSDDVARRRSDHAETATRKSEATLLDLDTSEKSAFDSCLSSGPVGAPRSLPSGLWRVDERPEGRPDNDKAPGISWASLIRQESERKERKKGKYRSSRKGRRARDEAGQSHSSPHATLESRSSGGSSGRRGAGSGGDERKRSSQGSRNPASWKEESAVSLTSSSDPDHVRERARERFERGVHYAERGRWTAARERFLTALRYRVMLRGGSSRHPDVAAAHEMLGHVHAFLGEEEEEEEEEEKVDSGAGSDRGDALGWDAAAAPEGDRRRRRRRGGNNNLEKAAMHFRTALKILGVDQSSSDGSFANSHLDDNVHGNRAFDWSTVAESYRGAEDDNVNDNDGSNVACRLEPKDLDEIIARVQERLQSLPAVRAGRKSSYVDTFLDS